MISLSVRMKNNNIDYEHLTEIQNKISNLIIENKKENYILKFETQLGKTRTAVMSLKGYKKPLIITPAKLSNQWLEELKRQNIDVYELITINKLNLKDNLKKIDFKNYDIIIVDEFQESIKSKTMKKIQKMKSLHLIGLSATPAGNDNMNYFSVAKTFFYSQEYIKKLTLQSFVSEYLKIDEEKAYILNKKGIKSFVPPTIKNEWKREFEPILNNVIELKREVKENKVSIIHKSFYRDSKYNVFTRYDGKKFFATSHSQIRKLNRLSEICIFDWNGSFETFKVIELKEKITEELDDLQNEKALIITRTPELARKIAEYLNCNYIIGDTKMNERETIYRDNIMVCTLQTVGVGVSTLHHLEKIYLLEPMKGQATIEQLRGRIMNNTKSNLELTIYE